MARLNIEDSFWSDQAVQYLIETIGADRAVGMAVRFMHLAQKHWAKPNRDLVPKEIFFRNKWEPLIDAGLAIEQKEGIYCRGSEQNFAWLVQKTEAGRIGGIKSGTSRKSDTSKEAARSGSKRRRSGSNPLTLTPTLTLTHNKKSKPKDSNPRAPVKFSAFDEKLSSDWIAWSKSTLPNIKSNPDKCAHAFRLLREQDKYSEPDLSAVFAFVKSDEFWSTNAYSPEGLRKKSKNGMTKIENIQAAMKQRAPAPEISYKAEKFKPITDEMNNRGLEKKKAVITPEIVKAWRDKRDERIAKEANQAKEEANNATSDL